MPEYKHLPALFNERINAFATDFMFVALVALIAIFMQWHPIIKVIVILIAWYGTSVLPYHFLKGQTIGKKWSGLIVLTKENQSVTLKTIYKREFFKFFAGLVTVGLYFLISFIVSEKRNDKMSIHDLIFNTHVVYKQSKIV